MDMYEQRAAVLEAEQALRLENYPPKEEWEFAMEAGVTNWIRRYRRISKTYNRKSPVKI